MALTDLEIGWLAGIVDGEGSVCIFREKASKTEHFYARCVVHVIANTNYLLISRVAQLLDREGIRYTIGSLLGEQKRQRNWNRAWNVKISGIDAMKQFLAMIRPHLVGKAEQAELALRFLARRHSNKRAWGITDEDETLMSRCQQLNAGAAESVETSTSRTAKAVMIQSDLGSDAEKPAEMTGSALN